MHCNALHTQMYIVTLQLNTVQQLNRLVSLLHCCELMFIKLIENLVLDNLELNPGARCTLAQYLNPVNSAVQSRVHCIVVLCSRVVQWCSAV